MMSQATWESELEESNGGLSLEVMENGLSFMWQQEGVTEAEWRKMSLELNRTERPGCLASLSIWMLKLCWVMTDCAREFNTEPDVFKY